MLVQCCTYSKWVHLRCSLFFFSIFKTLDSSHSWSFPLYCVPSCIGPTSINTVSYSLDSSSLYTSTVQPGPSSANAVLLAHPRLQTSYPHFGHFACICSLCTLPTPSCSWVFFYTSCFLFPPWLAQGSSMECWRYLSQEH